MSFHMQLHLESENTSYTIQLILYVQIVFVIHIIHCVLYMLHIPFIHIVFLIHPILLVPDNAASTEEPVFRIFH